MVLEQTVETALSLRELINRIHTSTEYLNKYIKEHDGAANPLQRAVALTKIVRERFRLQILVKKFGKAYLDAADRNIMEISAFVLKYPQYMPQLESVGQQIEKNFKWVMDVESRERDRAHMLRVYARNLIGKVKPTFKSVRRKIEALQRQEKQKAQQIPAHERGGRLSEEYKRKITAWQKQQSQLQASGRR